MALISIQCLFHSSSAKMLMKILYLMACTVIPMMVANELSPPGYLCSKTPRDS